MNAQFKRGILELCILKLISKQSISAYELLDIISTDLEVNENTIYPILRRLTKDGLLETEKVKSSIGAPRKQYTLTSEGYDALLIKTREWQHFLVNINKIMEDNNE